MLEFPETLTSTLIRPSSPVALTEPMALLNPGLWTTVYRWL